MRGSLTCLVVQTLFTLALGSDIELKAAASIQLRGAASAEEPVAADAACWSLAVSNQGPERDTLWTGAGFASRRPAVRPRTGRPRAAGSLRADTAPMRAVGCTIHRWRRWSWWQNLVLRM
jgi:hypothetical protein